MQTSLELALVLWADATGYAEPDDADLVLTLTAGWVVRADDEAIRIAQDVREDGSASSVTTIPWGMVRAVRRLGRRRVW